MAKRSDFAQKLLDDLRQRKERLASSSQSQSSNRSNSSLAIIDAYSYAKQNYRGSKDMRTNDMIYSKTGNAGTKSNISGRSSFSGDSSQHIVPYNNGRAQSSRQMGDLSMALAFALENGAKTKRTTDSPTMLAFLQQIGARSGAAASHIPAFSRSQLEEISRGARRLNQILRACSSGGVNLNQRSVQIGKELLRGAVDLENSLKVLVNFQQASEFSEKSQRKSRIKLLDEDEDEDEESGANLAEEWRLDRPRFSFDKAAKRGSDSDGRSASLIGSNAEKARIPNVIAKLMGLERLPEAENSSKNAAKGAAVGTLRKAAREIGKVFGKKANGGGGDNVSPPKKQRVAVEANPFVVNTSFVVVRERNPPSGFGSEVVTESEKATKRSEKAVVKRERNQDHVIKKNDHQGTRERLPLEVKRLGSEERDQGGAKPPARRARPKGSEAVSKSSLSRSNKQTHLSQEKKKSVRKGTSLVQSEGYTNGKHQDEVFGERISGESNAFKEAKSLNSDQSFSPRQMESEPRRQRARNVQAMDEKAIHAPNLQRIKVPKGHNKNESPRMIDQVVARRSARQQSSALKEAKKPRRLEKLGIHEEAKIKPNGSDANDQTVKEAEKTFALHTLKEDVRTRLKEPQQLPLSCQDVIIDDQLNQELNRRIYVANELADAKQHGSETMDIDVKTNTTSRPNTSQTVEQTKSVILTERENHLKQILIKSHLFLNTAEALFNLDIPINVLHSSSHNTTTANETNDNIIDQNDRDRRLVLDCGYELMRRKGRRQELSVHPNYAKVSISLVRVSTFDGLVRELSEGLERLRMYGRDHRDQCGAEDYYLPAMQEIDVYGREPDVNCMWDSGWDERVFAFVEVDEVVRDVEKFLLNALLDEMIAGDFLLHLGFS